MTQKVQNASEALERAKEKNEIFLGRLSQEELEKTGFDVSTFGPFEYADIYLQCWDERYKIKYIFDSKTEYYEKEDAIGGRDVLLEIVEEYLDIGGEG